MSWGLSCRRGFPEPGCNLCTRSVWGRHSAARAPHCRAASCQRSSWQCAWDCFRARQSLCSVSRVCVSQAAATCQRLLRQHAEDGGLGQGGGRLQKTTCGKDTGGHVLPPLTAPRGPSPRMAPHRAVGGTVDRRHQQTASRPASWPL